MNYIYIYIPDALKNIVVLHILCLFQARHGSKKIVGRCCDHAFGTQATQEEATTRGVGDQKFV